MRVFLLKFLLCVVEMTDSLQEITKKLVVSYLDLEITRESKRKKDKKIKKLKKQYKLKLLERPREKKSKRKENSKLV